MKAQTVKQLTPVKSSLLRAVGYDNKTLLLTILFSSGKTYNYVGVDEALYTKLTKSTSVGAFFNKSIKDKFPVTAVV